jgi:hypothetical protein
VPHTLKQISLNYSPASVHDFAEVLLEKMRARGGMAMSTDDAAGLLETERFRILSQATQVTNENDQVLQKGVSSVSMCMPCNDGTGTIASSKNIYTAQNSKFNNNLNGTLENTVLTVPTASEIFESAGFSAQNVVERKNSNHNDKNSLQDAVECVDFLDTIELNDDDNSVGVDLDAVSDNFL